MHVTKDWEHADSVVFGQECCLLNWGQKQFVVCFYIKQEVRWLFSVKADDYICLQKTEIIGS